MKQLTEEKLKKYFAITSRALKKAKICCPSETHLDKIGKDFYDMASRYFKDAEHFFSKDDYVNAFGALNYAHGWLDSGARLGIFDVDHDSQLFTVD